MTRTDKEKTSPKHPSKSYDYDRYLNNIGVQHYICDLINTRFSILEVEPYIPQLVHICINNPSRSIAIERLLRDLCFKSPHFCLQLHWLLNSYLLDLVNSPKAPEFKVCLRLFNAIQEILFFTPNLQLFAKTNSAESSRSLSPFTNIYLIYKAISQKASPIKASLSNSLSFLTPKVKHNAFAAIVGMSGIAASPAASLQVPHLQLLAVFQAYQSSNPHSKAHNSSDIASVQQNGHKDPTLKEQEAGLQKISINPLSENEPIPIYDNIYLNTNKGSLLSIADTLSNTGMLSNKQLAKVQDFANKLEADNTTTEAALSEYHLYFSSQIEFITELTEIAKRLVDIPSKPNRQASLQVELNIMNHFLLNNPNKCCVPILCNHSVSGKHDTIVRIPAEEAVVLNSAERAPYLVLFEVLRSKNCDTTINCKTRTKSLPLAPQSIKSPSADIDSAKITIDSSHSSELPQGDSDVPNPIQINADCPDFADSSLQALDKKYDNQIIQKTQSLPSNNSAVPHKTTEFINGDHQMPPISMEELEERMKTASVLLSQLNKHQKYLKSSKTTYSQTKNKPRSTIASHWSKNIYKLASITAPSKYNKPTYAPVRTLSQTENAETTNQTARISFSTSCSDRDSLSPDKIVAQNNVSVENSTTTLKSQPSNGITQGKSIFQFFEKMTEKNKITFNADHHANLIEQRVNSKAGLTTKGSKEMAHMHNQQKIAENVDPNIQIRLNLMQELMMLQEIKSQYYSSRDDKNGISQHDIKIVMRSSIEHVQQHNSSDMDTELESEINGRVDNGDEESTDKSGVVLGEDWDSKKDRIRKGSPFGHHENWDLVSVIIKEGTDLRQEKFALQLIYELDQLLRVEGITEDIIFLQHYNIMVTGQSSGIIETVANSISLHSLKKLNKNMPLYDHFIKTYGTTDTEPFKEAQANFMSSLVGYSLVCYFLQLKDRHNGNILLDKEGHLIHIDFGFMFNNSPGAIGFETAPFKLTSEYVDLLTCNRGITSSEFAEFKRRLKMGFKAIRKHSEHFISLIKMMAKNSNLPCLTNPGTPVTTSGDTGVSADTGSRTAVDYRRETTAYNNNTENKADAKSTNGISKESELGKGRIDEENDYLNSANAKTAGAVLAALSDRFILNLSESQLDDHVEKLVLFSYNNVNTILYDNFQYYSNGIL
ncbi:hypothetical protein BB561_003253 [Smittium simulii]|uniref:1-phosphatidylinositol 4-kinase n=1 Tax=Smittium simulii TaxID=133385 RepID=A0A2T9YMF7_9FUNG|nr:hypothetical protein BB561_003253 [Smittium simulii]